jgi:hypothetical protein
MTQYIIDEKMIKSWRKGCVNLSNPHMDDDTCKLCKHRGKGMRMDCCDFDDEDAECLFRSNPYNPQAELEKVLDEYNDELLTKLVQELAGTWRMRDAKLFSIIRKYRRVPIGAMKAELRQIGEL